MPGIWFGVITMELRILIFHLVVSMYCLIFSFHMTSSIVTVSIICVKGFSFTIFFIVVSPTTKYRTSSNLPILIFHPSVFGHIYFMMFTNCSTNSNKRLVLVFAGLCW